MENSPFLNQIVGRKQQPLAAHQWKAVRDSFLDCYLDFGTGDGRYLWRFAQKSPHVLCVGLDANSKNMREISRKASAKPKRGGVSNAVFVNASLERIPSMLEGAATRLTVLFPWGSLLFALVQTENNVLLGELARLMRHGAKVSFLINYDVFDDDRLRQKLGLPDLEQLLADRALERLYAQADLHLTRREMLEGAPPFSTSWGNHLMKGSKRRTLRIDAEKVQSGKSPTSVQEKAPPAPVSA